MRKPAGTACTAKSRKTKPRSAKSLIDERERRDAAIRDAARAGCSATKIARDLVALGFAAISPARVRCIMKRAGPATEGPLPDDFLTTELARLAQLQKALHAKALKGDNAAVDRVLAILERRAKLLGLSAPKPGDDADDASESSGKQILLQKLDAMAARLAQTPHTPAPGKAPDDETR